LNKLIFFLLEADWNFQSVVQERRTTGRSSSCQSFHPL